ncbi:PAS domain-containing protein [Escherichia coli]|uniref:PAS domain-containing protein n=1 Tax=Escherichia coli TaxID=562 RepID=UPI00388DED03
MPIFFRLPPLKAISRTLIDFIKISGFTEEELLGQPHNIVRHPDMPPAAFEHMWSTLKSGRSWMGLVKNRCKNGDHYWVSAYVTPIAKNGSIVEYQSVRTKPEPEQVLAAEKLYAQLRSGKAARPKLAASFSVKILLLIWGSIISSAMAAGMLTDTSISSLLLATLMSGSLTLLVFWLFSLLLEDWLKEPGIFPITH